MTITNTPWIRLPSNISLTNDQLFDLPEGIRIYRDWPGDRSGTPWRAAQAFSFVAAQFGQLVDALRRDAAEPDFSDRDYGLRIRGWGDAVNPALADAQGIEAAALAEQTAEWQLVQAGVKPQDATEAVVFAAIWAKLGTGPVDDPAATMLARSMVLRALSDRDVITLRALAAAPSAFGLRIPEDQVQPVFAQVAPKPYARWVGLGQQLAFVADLRFQTERYVGRFLGVSRSQLAVVAEENAMRARFVVSGGGQAA